MCLSVLVVDFLPIRKGSSLSLIALFLSHVLKVHDSSIVEHVLRQFLPAILVKLLIYFKSVKSCHFYPLTLRITTHQRT